MDEVTKVELLNLKGKVLLRLDRTEDALVFYHKALSSNRTKNPNLLQKSYIGLGLLYYAEKMDSRKALYFLKKAEEQIKLGAKSNNEETYLNIAMVLIDLQKIDLVLKYLYKVNQSPSDNYIKPNIELLLGTIYKLKKNDQEMIRHFDNAMIFAKELDNKNVPILANNHLAEFYDQHNELKKAYFHKLKGDSIIGSISLEKQKMLVSELKAKEQNSIAHLEKKRLTEKFSIEASKRRLQQVFIVVLFVFSALFVYLYRLQKKKNIILVKKNLESIKTFNLQENAAVEESNLSISEPTDSGIKRTFAPSDEIISKLEKLLLEKELFKDPDITTQKLALKLILSQKVCKGSVC